ncbi:hypothetical protein BUALT_Bualt17G0092400 [Buddleja alternifolia]|uniref:Uncharacterized protein n=1 Tax=Buddleja alternifolia TaxID=168488 RepID=A0AAV6WFM6_9LAMI|nr:hypothetical protein BUALT_Bualt17G0092400 [Buddleja alternifolia]
MVRPMPIIHISETFSPIPLAIGLFVTVSLLVGLCAKHGRQFQRKCTSKTSDPNTAKSPLASPRQLIATISNKAMPLIHTKKSGQQESTNNKGMKEENNNNGLWQKAILMGERCQPPEFSGVIYYDYSGNRIQEMPKSPRAGSMSPLRNFTFPVQKHEDSSLY